MDRVKPGCAVLPCPLPDTDGLDMTVYVWQGHMIRIRYTFAER